MVLEPADKAAEVVAVLAPGRRPPGRPEGRGVLDDQRSQREFIRSGAASSTSGWLRRPRSSRLLARPSGGRPERSGLTDGTRDCNMTLYYASMTFDATSAQPGREPMPELSDADFGARLRGLVDRSGLSMRRLSAAMGRDPGYVAALLDPARPSRARPTPADLVAAAGATGIPLVEWLRSSGTSSLRASPQSCRTSASAPRSTNGWPHCRRPTGGSSCP